MVMDLGQGAGPKVDMIEVPPGTPGAIFDAKLNRYFKPDPAATGVVKTVPSESDARTVNNTVRHNYRVLSDAEKAAMVKVKDLGQSFIDNIADLGKSRELSLALTNAEQAVMWAVKHITA